MVLTSFNQKAYEKDLYEEGVEDGLAKGLEKGRLTMAQEISLRLFNSGNSPEQISELTGIPVEKVTLWIQKAE